MGALARFLDTLRQAASAPPATERREPRFAASSNTITQSVDLERVFLRHGTATAAGVAVNITTAERFATVYACIRVLSLAMAQLPIHVFRQVGMVRQPLDGHWLARLMAKPGERMIPWHFKVRVCRDLMLRGNSYWLKAAAVGRVVELRWLHPDRVTAKADRVTGIVTYEFRRPADGRTVAFADEQVLHIRGPGDDELAGHSPIAVQRETIGDAIASRQHGARFFSNGAKLGGILQPRDGAKSLTPEAARELLEDFDSLYAGGANAHRTAVLPGGLEFKELAISNEDAQFLETRQFNRTEICAIFGVPPHMVGDLSRATFSNIEHQGLEFVVHALMPWLVLVEQTLRDGLGAEADVYLKFNVDAFLRGDALSRARALQIERLNGVISANEWRALTDRNPRTDPGGDDYIVPMNTRVDDPSMAPADPAAAPRQGAEP